MDAPKTKTESPEITLRKPAHSDGAAVWDLVRACSPLDENSMYCNLIQCDHFADTCILAEMEGRVVGWVSGYVTPTDPDTLFVWQVAVDAAARGRGLGTKMLNGLLGRDACREVTRLQTTITRDNAASWSLFTRFAKALGARLQSEAYYTSDEHFRGIHATEHMVTITLAEALTAAA